MKIGDIVYVVHYLSGVAYLGRVTSEVYESKKYWSRAQVCQVEHLKSFAIDRATDGWTLPDEYWCKDKNLLSSPLFSSDEVSRHPDKFSVLRSSLPATVRRKATDPWDKSLEGYTKRKPVYTTRVATIHTSWESALAALQKAQDRQIERFQGSYKMAKQNLQRAKEDLNGSRKQLKHLESLDVAKHFKLNPDDQILWQNSLTSNPDSA